MATSTAAADAANPTLTTTYYVSDQIASTRMDIAYGSWPTWWGAFDPYGAEIDTNATTNNFKFSGKERDAQTGESGLDNFGARSYSSNLVGKFMQPDPAGLAAANLWSPQSFNLYSYVMNNPLSLADPTGMYSCQVQFLPIEQANSWLGGYGATDGTCAAEPQPDPPDSIPCIVASDGKIYCTQKVTADTGDIDCNKDPASCLIVGQFRQKRADAIAAMVQKNSGKTYPSYKGVFCAGDALAAKGASIALDAAGAFPGLGNVASASAAGAKAVKDAVTWGGGVAGAGMSLSDDKPYGAAFAGGGLGLAIADLSLGGTKALPIIGNFAAGGAALWDLYGAYKAYAGCMAKPG